METFTKSLARETERRTRGYSPALIMSLLKEKLRVNQARRRETFATYAARNDNNKLARRVLAGSYGQWTEDKTEYFADNWQVTGLRDQGDAHDVCKANSRPRAVDHTGWYTDAFHGAKMIGRVLQFSAARDGTPRYVCGTYCDEWDGVTVHFGDGVFNDPVECAVRADRIAELAAEQCRDEDARNMAAQRIEDELDQVKQSRKECLELLRNMRAMFPARKSVPRDSVPVLYQLRLSVSRYRTAIRAHRLNIANFKADYWSAVE